MMSALWHVVDGAGDRISKEDLAKSPWPFFAKKSSHKIFFRKPIYIRWKWFSLSQSLSTEIIKPLNNLTEIDNSNLWTTGSFFLCINFWLGEKMWVSTGLELNPDLHTNYNKAPFSFSIWRCAYFRQS
jgi:hypothetical protein